MARAPAREESPLRPEGLVEAVVAEAGEEEEAEEEERARRPPMPTPRRRAAVAAAAVATAASVAAAAEAFSAGTPRAVGGFGGASGGYGVSVLVRASCASRRPRRRRARTPPAVGGGRVHAAFVSRARCQGEPREDRDPSYAATLEARRLSCARGELSKAELSLLLRPCFSPRPLLTFRLPASASSSRDGLAAAVAIIVGSPPTIRDDRLRHCN